MTSTKQHLWCNSERCEERDGAGILSNGKQFFDIGQANFASGTPTAYFYNGDHLGAIREMTKTVSGTTSVEAAYAYDPYGQVTKISGSSDSDFQYAGYYVHARSGLNLTRTRAYSAPLGRFINRDPIKEAGGLNLYAYCTNEPVSLRDPAGTCECPKKDDPTTMAGVVVLTRLTQASPTAVLGGEEGAVLGPYTMAGGALLGLAIGLVVTAGQPVSFYTKFRIHPAKGTKTKEDCYKDCLKKWHEYLDKCPGIDQISAINLARDCMDECDDPPPPDGGMPIQPYKPDDNVVPIRQPLRRTAQQ